ncbi:MAG: HD domain-containing phosphohydrolase [Planctomycetaceae bacterium]
MAESTTLNREQTSSYTTIKLSGLRVGTRLRAPIYEGNDGDRNVLLLASGTVISASVLEKLKQRGISEIRVLKSEVHRLTSGSSNSFPAVAKPSTLVVPGLEDANFGTGQWGAKPDSFIHKLKTHEGSTYSKDTSKAFSSSYTSSAEHTKSFFDNLSSGTTIDGGAIVDLSANALDQLTDDLDLFVSLGIRDKAHEYPYKHGLQSSRLAMAVGTVMGLKKDELYDLGIGCLVHDVGMLKIDRNLYEAPRRLSELEFLEISKHPSITFDLIKDIKELRMGSRMVAYQMHERFNGTGYPRKRAGRQIHHLARIAAVADAFVALISPRPYRPAMLPYYAIEQIVRGCQDGLFDADVVRGLLYTTSLFPIGSFIELSDGRVGKVVRSNRIEYTRPVVELWLPDKLELPPNVVDLKGEKELFVERPLSEIPTPDFLYDHFE